MSKFRNLLLLVALLSCLQTAKANGLLEGNRLSQKVVYANGWVEVACNKKCVLIVDLDGRKYEFNEDKLGLRLVPDHLRLFHDNATRATIETEIVCNSYANAPPAYYCLSGITIDDGKVELIQKFQRTESDSNYSTSIK
jgi:hypothetical protein